MAFLLGAGVVSERRAQGDDVVGEDARLGVAHDRRDGLRLACDLRLSAERLELTTDLAGEIAEPCEVRLHRVELAEGLLLATAMLEDAGGLFDESTPILRRGLEHGVETPLPDDDVHLAAEA